MTILLELYLTIVLRMGYMLNSSESNENNNHNKNNNNNNNNNNISNSTVLAAAEPFIIQT
jgi:hypothetical protein